MSSTSSVDESVDAVLKWLTSRAGLKFSTSRRISAGQIIDRLAQRFELPSVHHLHGELDKNAELLDALLDAMTIGESYFFRTPGHFELIEASLLKEIGARRAANEPMRFWSAGCAHGPEILSLALLLERVGLLERSVLLATDLSRDAIERARQGRFSRWDLRSSDEETWKRSFQADDEHFLLSPELVDRVQFFQHNLADDDYLNSATPIGDMDLILCRNVLLYFDEEMVSNVARRLFDALAPGGYLITAATDPNLARFAPFEVISTAAGHHYRRPLNDEAKPVVVDRPSEEVKIPSSTGKEEDRRLAPEIETGSKSVLEDASTPTGDRDSGAVPAMPQFYYRCGVDELAGGRPAEALVAIRRSLFLAPEFVMAHCVMATIWRQLDEPERSRSSLINVFHLCREQPAEALIPEGRGITVGELADEILDRLSPGKGGVRPHERN